MKIKQTLATVATLGVVAALSACGGGSGKFYCAPKDFSTLQLVINDKLWKAAGLTEADYPKTWDDLATVGRKLTQGKVKGLTFSPEIQRVGAFPAQGGGGLVNRRHGNGQLGRERGGPDLGQAGADRRLGRHLR